MRSARAAALLVAAAIFGAAEAVTRAGDGAIVIEQAWARASPPGAPAAAAYLRLINRGAAPDRLIGAEISGAERVELHETATEGDVVRMRPLPGGLPLAPGETVELKPGGAHLMLRGLTRPLVAGESLPAALILEHAGRLPVVFSVEPIGAARPGAAPR